MAFPLHAGIFKLQSELDLLPLQSFVCVTDRPLMAGLPGAVHYALASSRRRTQKVLSGLATQTTQHPHPRASGWGLCGVMLRLWDAGWGRACRGRRPGPSGPGGNRGGWVRPGFRSLGDPPPCTSPKFCSWLTFLDASPSTHLGARLCGAQGT